MTEAMVYEEQLIIPTYLTGEPSLNPVILGYRGVKSYPYLIRDELTDVKEEVGYDALVLENEYLKVSVLPGLGGRLYAAQDKRNGREIFYKNRVIKPQLIGLTGAWFAGGIEWNFPRGHRPSTMERVAAYRRSNSDGSVSAFVGEHDRITGLRFLVELRLYPGKAFIEETVQVSNPGHLPARYMFWSTSAEYETEHLELRYPMKWGIDEHTRRRYPWPLDRYDDRRDLRWIGNTREPTTIFGSNVKHDFFGTYDRKLNCGLVHVANHREVPGKKMWAWGMDAAGRRWNALLTDEDGPYVEVQSGIPDNQNELLLLGAHASLQWKEYWFQAIETGPFTHAGLYGAMSWRLDRDAGGHFLELKIRANEDLPECALSLSNGPDCLHTGRYDFSPGRTVDIRVGLRPEALARGTLRIALEDRAGRRLMAANIRENGEPLAEIEALPERQEREPEGSLFHQAYQHELFDRYRQALALYDAHLARNEDCVAALIGKAVIMMRMLDHARAAAALESACRKEPQNKEVQYYLGLARYCLGETGRARDALYFVNTSSPFYGPSAVLTGLIMLREGDYLGAEEQFRSARSIGPADGMASFYLAHALRKQGSCEEAEAILAGLLDRDPLHAPARYEHLLLLEEQGKDAAGARRECGKIFPDEPHGVLAVAAVYQEAGDYAGALRVVEAAPCGADPLLLYHAGYYHDRLGRREQAEELWRRAEAGPVERVFPNHPATVDVLAAVIGCLGSGAVKARYYLGLLYQARERYDEAAGLWQECLALGMEYSVLHRCLGYIAWRIMGDAGRAVEILEHGLAAAPFNPEIPMYLNLIYRERGETEKRRELLGLLEGVKPLPQTLARTLLNVYNDLGRWGEAVRLFTEYPFRQWEHDENPVLNLTALGATAYLGRAKALVAAQRFADAAADLEKCAEIAEKDKDLWSQALYGLGICREQLGDFPAALACYRRITADLMPPGTGSHDNYLKAMARMVDLNWLGVE